MDNRTLAWMGGLVLGLGCFVGSFLAAVAVAGAAIGPPKPEYDGKLCRNRR